MMLGKRPRPPMKRTTSMSEIAFDLNTSTVTDAPPLSPHNPFHRHRAPPGAAAGGGGTGGPLKPPGGFNNGSDPRVSMAPTNYRRHSADFTHTPDFLRSCSLCKRPLIPSRDIYMYRGDSAFCSLECRQHAMNQDERKKCSVASKKKVVAPSAGSQVTSKGETVAAL